MLIMCSGGGRPSDAVPDQFAFTSQIGVAPSALIVSNSVNITGTNTDSPITCTGCTISINGGAYISSGVVPVGGTVSVKLQASASWQTSSSGTVTIGGISATFTVTTIAQDIVPDTFTFMAVTNATLSTEYISNTVNITGITGNVVVGSASGFISINGGAWVTSGSITNGQTLSTKTTSSSTYSTANGVSVTVGSNTVTFSITTRAVPNYCPNLTVTGINAGTRYSGLSQLAVSAGKYYFEITATYAQAYAAVSINSAAIASIAFGGTVGVQLDADAGIIYCNGVQKTITGARPYAVMIAEGLGTAITNFGQAAFVGSVPVGYNAGFYS